MPKEDELDRICAERGWTVEGRVGGKTVGEETAVDQVNEEQNDRWSCGGLVCKNEEKS